MEPVTLGNKIYDIFREEQKVVDGLRRRGAVGEDFGKLIPKFGVGDRVSWNRQPFESRLDIEDGVRVGTVSRVLLGQDGVTYFCEVARDSGGLVSARENVFTLVEDSVDMVNHPPHYTSHPSGVECIEVVRHYSFPIGSAIKYLWRAGLKGGEDARIEDLRKAVFYIEDEITRLENK